MRQLIDKNNNRFQQPSKNISGIPGSGQAGNTVVLLPWLCEHHVSGEGTPQDASLEARKLMSWYGLLYASGRWGCSLAASKGGKGLERQQGEQALNSSGALGTLAGGWRVQSCPW